MERMFKLIYRIIIFLYKKIDKSNWASFGNHSCVMLPTCKINGKKYIRLGDFCVIGKNARIEAIDMYAGVKYRPNLIIEDKVYINQNFHCTCANSVIIGSGTSITANCAIFDIIHPYEDIRINPRDAKIKIKPIKIGKNCLIGMNSVVLPGSIIGDHCVVGANSIVIGEIPSYSVVVGSPAKIIKRYDFISQTWRKTDEKGEFLN